MRILRIFKELDCLLEYFERTNLNFWLLTCLFGITLNVLPFNPMYSIQSPTTEPCLEKTIGRQTALKICGGDKFFGLGKRRKFDLAYHRRLEKRFPDWQKRVDYQKKQEELYKSAMKKQREIKRLRIKDVFYTKEELDAIDYFHGTGIYRKHQDPSVKPNIYDTRQSLLIKMHDPVMCKNFIKTYKFYSSQ